MKEIFDKISNIFKLPRIPVTPTPSPLVLTGIPRRPGLRASMVAERIISRKQEAGLPVGVLDNGDPNPDEIMYRIVVEEIFKALEQEAVIEVAIRPGDQAVGAGGNAGGPVVVNSTTVTIGSGYGIIK